MQQRPLCFTFYRSPVLQKEARRSFVFHFDPDSYPKKKENSTYINPFYCVHPPFSFTHCGGQVLIFVKITTHVQSPEGSTALPAGPVHLQAWQQLNLRDTNNNPHLIRHHSPGAARLFGTPTTNIRTLSYWHKDPSRSHSKLRHKDPPEPATLVLLTDGMHDPRDSWIRLRRQINPTF